MEPITIQEYYARRGLKTPDVLESLLWLISEIGELTEAYLYSQPMQDLCRIDQKTMGLLEQVKRDGVRAENIVQGAGGWVRNNDRVREPVTADEAADVLMMLSVFCQRAGLPEPSKALQAKMQRKLAQAAD